MRLPTPYAAKERFVRIGVAIEKAEFYEPIRVPTGALVVNTDMPAGRLAGTAATIWATVQAICLAMVSAPFEAVMVGAGHMVPLLYVRGIPLRSYCLSITMPPASEAIYSSEPTAMLMLDLSTALLH
jgi:hypothetical protein